MNLYGIQSSDIAMYWPVVAPLVMKPFVRLEAYKDYDVEDVLENIRAGKQQCWIAHEDDRVTAVFITQIIVRKKRKVLFVPLIGAETGTIKQWIGAIEVFKAFADEKGCDAILGIGRKGWEKVLNPDRVRIEYEFKVGK